MKQRAFIRKFLRGDSGAAALEFAIVGPMMVLMILGICSYGGYFWISHSVQQVANDAARAAMGGLDNTERSSLAQATLADEIGDYVWLTATHATVSVVGDTNTVTVAVAYDASHTPFWSLSGLVPMPSKTISRSATVRLGGY
ncbi:MAG: pilus assembly protein [Caulobacter sp.]|nr:pilus assembly protein [Caulobacter sp.]